jgi:hypothetical protein
LGFLDSLLFILFICTVITFKQNVPVNLFKVNIDGNKLELSWRYEVYLGVTIDNKFKFGKNVQQIEKKKLTIAS